MALRSTIGFLEVRKGVHATCEGPFPGRFVVAYDASPSATAAATVGSAPVALRAGRR